MGFLTKHQFPTNQEFNQLFDSVGWGNREDEKINKHRQASCFAVCVYDGSEISLYCDGELIKTSAAGELVFPSVAKTYLGIGGDLSGNDQGEDQMSGTIALARIYSDALNASQVYNLYLEAVQG